MTTPTRPLVIAHRGASGYAPEHTLAAYFIAVQQGADYIEPDLVSTKDGVLIARHENELSETTDVPARTEFAGRKTVKTIDGRRVEGWFSEDFSLAEIKMLRVRERLPHLRPSNTRFDGHFAIPTLDEVLSMLRALESSGRPRIGVYPETKHPSYFRRLGLPLEDSLLRTLEQWGYHDKNAPVFIQSFEVGNLKTLRRQTDLKLVQLIDAGGAPFDVTVRGDSTTYAHLASVEGLHDVARYAHAIGVHKDLVIPRDAGNVMLAPTELVDNAHAFGLVVHVWTLRAENYFLPHNLQSSSNLADFGRLHEEIEAFARAGVDGFFSDHPDLCVRPPVVTC